MSATISRFALTLADAAKRETLGRFRIDGEVDDKSGGGLFDPVTEADRGAERAMRALIEAEYPDHGIAGEEFGLKPSSSRYRWSLDPVDGTRSFTCGLPHWVTLIGFLEDEVPVLGVIDAPCLDERYVAFDGTAALHSAGSVTPLHASGCASISHARLSTTDPHLFAGAAGHAFERIRGAARTVRFGLDGYAYARLAAGTIDLVIEAGLREHDYQALIPVVRGAGGTFGDWRGGEDFSAGHVIAAATPQLYESAVEIMRSAA